MEENNLNQANIIPNTPKPETKFISPEISNLSSSIRNNANSTLVDSNPNLYGLNLNDSTSVGTDQRISLNKFDVGRDAYVELNDGTLISRFDKYMPGINNEELLARQQTSGDKWANALPKFAGKVGVNVLGGVVGSVEGLINGIRMQSIEAIYNSDFNKYLDDLNTKLDYKLPNYYTEQEKNMNFGQKLGTANFWANDFLGGLSFLVGTVISEGLWAYATGGTSLIARGLTGGLTRGLMKGLTKSQSLSALNTVKASGKQMIRAGVKTNVDDLVKGGIQANRIMKGAQTARFLYTSAGFEAGVEARHYIKEATEEWTQQFINQNGRRPTPEELAIFKDSVGNAANTLFAANVALVGGSNLAILGGMFLNKAPTKAISNSLFKKNFLGIGYKKAKDGGLKAIKANKFQKAFGKVYGVAKAPFTEGVIEEGGQAVMSTAASEYVLSAYDKDNVGDGLGLIDSLIEGFKYTYGTKQGLTEVGLGALIGVLGGGMATNFRFNEVSSTRKQMDTSVEYVNKFTRDNLVENLKFSAKLRKSTIDSERARAEGNMTNEMRADLSGMTNLAERAYHFQNKDETIADFNTAMDAVEEAELMKEYGFTSEEVAEWKGIKKEEFANVMETHTRNLQFAEGMVGNTPIAGIDEIGLDDAGVSDLKGAIAYTLTMGTKSDEFAEALANQIKLNVAKELGINEELDAVSVNEVLRKIEPKARKKYNAKAAQVAKIQKDITIISRKLVEAQAKQDLIKDKEGNQATAQQVTKLGLQLTKAQETLARLETEKDLAFEAMNIEQLTDEEVTTEMLDNQAANVSKLANVISKITTSDPQRGELIKQLHSEYSRAVDNAKQFDNLVKQLLDPKTQVSTLSGWVGKIVNKKKSVNGDTAQLFVNMVNDYQSDFERINVITGVINAKKEAGQVEAKPEETDTNEDPTQVEPEDITQPEATEVKEENPLQETKSLIENLKKRIKDLITRNPYTSLEYQGKDFNYDTEAPSQQDINRYNELLKKFTGKNINLMLRRPFNPKYPKGLTEAETNELQELNAKLNNWKILSGLQDTNNDSVADILQLINQLETDYQLTPTKINIPATELPTSKEVESSMGANALNTVVAPDVAMAKKDKKTKSYQFSHLKPTGLLNLFRGAKLYLVKGNRNVDVDSMPPKDLADAQVTKGNKFVITTAEGKDLVFEVVDRQRLSVSEEALEEVLNTDDTTKIVPYGNGNFMIVHTKAGEEYIPLQGDFVEASINDNEVIVLDSQRMNELEEGTPLRTVVNLNETFNAKLIQDYNNSKKTKEDKEYLINNLKIYLSPEGSVNKPIGFLRAILGTSTTKSDTYTRLHLIRQQAAEAALKSKTPRVEVGITIPFKRAIPGAPNMNVKMQDGKLVAAGTSITQEALAAVEDYGYVLNGNLHTKKGVNLDKTDLITIFATSVSRRNPNTKVPIVIFEFKGKRYAFPVSLKDRGGNKEAEIAAIINNQEDSDLAKVVKINELLLENNIDPRKFGITSMESPGLVRALEVLSRRDEETQLRDVVDVETWLDENHNKTTLLNSVEIGIDITDKPFHSPKGILDLQNMKVPTEDDMRVAAVENLEKLGREVNSMFAKDNPFANMTEESEFFVAWEEVGIDGKVRDESQKLKYTFKVANANIVIDAFSKNIPIDVRRVLGNEKIGEIKAAIKEFQLIKNGLKPTITFVNQEGSEAVQEQENKCN